ncbi:MAG: ABC transporter permease [Candidatus Hydrogenedentes bacterium]|nr:ABC transporter permease [Candidatus Hydrogenedentota bacterium]
MVRKLGVLKTLFRGQLSLVFALLLLITFFSIKTEFFFSYPTIVTIINQIPHILILSIGMSIVLISGGIDLSVGSVLAVSSAILGVLITNNWNLIFAVLGCLVAGIVCGAINGFIVVKWSIPPFIVTLGMLEVGRGLTYLITNSKTQYLGSNLDFVFAPLLFGIRVPIIFAVAILIFSHILLKYTPFGRHCFAVGANVETARLSGINVKVVIFLVYVLSGFFASLAGLIHSARLSSSDPNAGIGYELSAIASAVIGGNSLSGGKGSVFGTLLGVLIIATLEVGLVQLGVPEPWKRVITGFVIVFAVVLDFYRTKFVSSSTQNMG